MVRATIGIFVALGCLAAECGEASFAVKPQVSRSGGKTVITFKVSGKTDVAVSVLDAKGKVVRHLAAGVLGAKNPPPTPLKPGLSQSLEWDGKDDYGKPAAGGPFRVRVSLGLKPEFDRMIGDSPAYVAGGLSMNKVVSLGIGPDGTLYVLSALAGFGMGSSHGVIKAFDRNGEYLRTVAPYPANTAEEKLKGIKRVKMAPDRTVPFVFNAETRALIPGLGETYPHRMLVTSSGRLIVNGTMGVLRQGKRYRQLVSVNSDGSIPAEGLLGPKAGTMKDSGALAQSPDGKTIYIVEENRICALKWSGGERKVLVASGLSKPVSIAVDGDGNLYVADRSKDRVAVFKPNGSALGELKVDSPGSVAVHPKTGVVYVLGGKEYERLSKFASWKTAKPAARVTLPSSRHKFYSAFIALDASARPPVLWVGSPRACLARFGVLRLEDKGGSFGSPVDLAKLPANRGESLKATDMFIADGKLYVYSQRGYFRPRAFNALTGKPEKMPGRFKYSVCVGFILQSGRDGNFYVASEIARASALSRYDANLKELPYPGVEGGKIKGLGSCRTRLRGLCVDAGGRAYVIRQKKPSEGTHRDPSAVAVIGPDGKIINDKLIDSDIRGLNSVRVDPRGNVYLAVGARVGGGLLPPHLKGRLPDSPKDPDAERGHNYYPLMYGSIVKFGPEGGEVRLKGDGQPASFGYGRKAFIKGAKWSFFGASIVPSWIHAGKAGMQPNICSCESPRFDVDGFGRSFFGDACGFRVGVLDSAGNLIKWFGNYGNQDSAGPKSAVPVPAIPIGWVHGVAVGDEACFIGDRLNQRVVRVKLGYEAEKTCPLP